MWYSLANCQPRRLWQLGRDFRKNVINGQPCLKPQLPAGTTNIMGSHTPATIKARLGPYTPLFTLFLTPSQQKTAQTKQ